MIVRLEDLDPREAYKLMISLIVPRPIAWVTTLNEDGSVNAAPFSFFNGVTGRPPIVAISVSQRRDGEKDTAKNIGRTGQYVINLVDEEHAAQMNRTATEFPYGTSEPEAVGLSLTGSETVEAPRLEGTPAALECVVERIVEVGDPPTSHILGRVLAFWVGDHLEWDREAGIHPDRLRLIGRMGQNRYTLTREVFEMDRIPYPPPATSDRATSPGRSGAQDP